jgi:hypothetical protein
MDRAVVARALYLSLLREAFMPEMPNFVWAGCVNADANGMDRFGNPHFPDSTCTWTLKKPAPPSPAGTTP